jgi:hypothetical protein
MLKKWICEIGALLSLILAGPISHAAVWQQLSAPGPCDRYEPLTAAQLRQAESLFSRILGAKAIDIDSLNQEWSALGYVAVEVPAAGDGWIGLREHGPGCRGQGIYLINKRPQGSLVVQAPHAYHDLHSGEIAGGLLSDDIAILGWNSTKRRVLGPSDIAADLARRRDSLMTTLTHALIQARPRGRLIQIHGFAGSKRRTPEAAGAAIIVSGGSRWPTPAVEQIAACLRTRIAGPVRIYPSEVAELGATTNLQGQRMRRHGHEGFVHLELNRPTREKLRMSSTALNAFSACLARGLMQ